MTAPAKSTGLRYWMMRVLEECEHVSTSFSADPVHDLRVALRRCRSMADGMMAMDPDPEWKAMKKSGKRLFQSLGELRDVQIMMEWIDKLEPASVRLGAASSPAPLPPAESLEQTAVASPAAFPDLPSPDPAHTLLQILRQREAEQKHAARAALEEFDRKQWRHWSRILPQRAARIRPGSAVFKHLALERCTAARELHTRALRNRSQVAFHTLRIGIKRFRYIVENFLPVEHAAWSNDLKHMQDLLGEVHDLDVLWATALSCHVFPDDESRQRWQARISEERSKRIEEYRQRTTGSASLWNVWRSGLPQGNEIPQIATRRMKLWAKALDPDFAHSERVARLALELYDGLAGAGLLGNLAAHSASQDSYQGTPSGVPNGSQNKRAFRRWNSELHSSHGQPVGNAADARDTLHVAALLHDVGRSDDKKGHHKRSLELIKAHGTPLGWKPENMRRAAVVSRFHCGALPTRSHKALRDFLPHEQRVIIRLAAILRLANAFDAEHNGHIRHVRIEDSLARSPRRERRTNGFLRKPATPGRNEALIISAEGYTQGSLTAQTIAAERYLLETVLRRPVVVKPGPGLRRSVLATHTTART
ncbi:MAG TPA: CHAD domain-containing protein [Candidatus Acidoferrales bacterium]|nr:CHAD domain-containing protein [Candidatus Acidoferrales bacterium]